MQVYNRLKGKLLQYKVIFADVMFINKSFQIETLQRVQTMKPLSPAANWQFLVSLKIIAKIDLQHFLKRLSETKQTHTLNKNKKYLIFNNEVKTINCIFQCETEMYQLSGLCRCQKYILNYFCNICTACIKDLVQFPSYFRSFSALYFVINTGKRTKWSAIPSVIIQVITKSVDREAGV